MAENKDDTGGTKNPPQTIGEILAEMRAARTAFHTGNLPENDYVNKIVALDRALTPRLTNSFNNQSGFLVSLPDDQLTAAYRTGIGERLAATLPTEDIEQKIIEQLQASSDRPAAFFAPENEMASRQEIMTRMLQNHPQLKTMTLADAVGVIEKTSKGETVDWKYGEADGPTVLCAALTLVNINRDRLRTEHPSLYRALESSSPEYIRDVVSERILGKVEQDEEFVAWEGEKRDLVIKAIQADKGLMTDIGKIKPLVDSTDEQELLSQHRLRDSITQKMAGIFARIYDTPELARPGVVTTTYAPIEKLQQSDTYGYSGGVAGVKNEDYAFIRTSLYAELLLKDPTDTRQEVGEKFLATLTEEIRHGVDNIYSDRLVNGQLDKDHPAFRHTNLIFLNNFNYIKEGDAYAEQYVERTAKEAAAEITAVVAGDIYPPAPPPSGPPEHVMTLEGMTIRGGAKP